VQKASYRAVASLCCAPRRLSAAQQRQSRCAAGINIVLKAIEAPIRQISENSGVEGSIVVARILENKSETYGFDAQTRNMST